MNWKLIILVAVCGYFLYGFLARMSLETLQFLGVLLFFALIIFGFMVFYKWSHKEYDY